MRALHLKDASIIVDAYLRELPVHRFILHMIFITIFLSFAIIPLFLLFDIKEMGGKPMDFTNIFDDLLLFVVIAPVIETLVFQTLFFSAMRLVHFFRRRMYLIILTSALFFGLLHSYSAIYVLYGFLGGIVFSYSYAVYMQKPQSAFGVVAAIHSIRNFLSFIIAVVLHFFPLQSL